MRRSADADQSQTFVGAYLDGVRLAPAAVPVLLPAAALVALFGLLGARAGARRRGRSQL